MKSRVRLFAGVVAVAAIGWPVLRGTGAPTEEAPGMTAQEALLQLSRGNKRAVAEQYTHPHQTVAQRTTVAQGQHPFAIILSCADSRVPPEVVFDQGLGDLFVVRVAGNVVDDHVLGSIEYAAEHLGAKLVVVLGHERCGAVDAAVKGGHAPGHIGSLVEAIQPAVDDTKNDPGDRLDNAVRANIGNVVKQVAKAEPILSEKVKAGQLRVVGARYDLDTGEVEFLK